MTRTIPIQNLSAATRDLLAGISPGEELIIEQAGQPVARITPLVPKSPGQPRKRPLGIWKGKVWISPDFDDELPEGFWCPPGDPLTK